MFRLFAKFSGFIIKVSRFLEFFILRFSFGRSYSFLEF